MWIGDDCRRRGDDLVTFYRLSRVGIIDIDHHGGEPGFDHHLNLFIGPNGPFHNPAGNTPYAGEKEDDGFARLYRLMLSRGVVLGPDDVVRWNVEIMQDPENGNRDHADPEPAPKVELATRGGGGGVGGRQ